MHVLTCLGEAYFALITWLDLPCNLLQRLGIEFHILILYTCMEKIKIIMLVANIVYALGLEMQAVIYGRLIIGFTLSCFGRLILTKMQKSILLLSSAI